MTKKTLKNRIEAIEKQVPEPTKNDNDKTPSADDYKELLLNFARDYPQHHDYIVQRVEAVEREHGFLLEPNEDENRATLIGRMLAWTNEQQAMVDRHLTNLEHDYESENARCEAKELLEKIRAQNELIAAEALNCVERERERRLTSE